MALDVAAEADVIRDDLGIDLATTAGMGAAGGTPVAAVALFGARMTPGIALILDIIGFAAALTGADLVITGEGSLDEQSLAGKAPIGVARAAAAAAVPVTALVGRLDVDRRLLGALGIRHAHALLDIERDPGIAQNDAARLLTELTAQVLAGTMASR